MKIIQICAAYKPAYVYGGPTMSVSKLSEELVKAGQDVTVLTTTANGKSELDVPISKETLVDGVKVYYFKRWTKDHTHFSPALFWFLHKTIKNAKRIAKATPSPKERAGERLVIHIHAWWNLISIFSCLVAKLHGVKIILSPRGMLNEYTLSNRNSISKRIIHFLWGKNLLKYTDIHATSNKESIDINQFLGKKAHIISNFVKIPSVISLQNNKTEAYNLVFLGRINEIKGLENLFLALSQIKIDWQLNIGGEGETSYLESLKTLAITHNIQHQINWLDHVNNETKFTLLSSADLLILPSFKENFANVVIEALAVGTPVLISNGVGLSDYVEQTNLGWISSNMPEQLAQTINQSFLEKEKRECIRKQAPEIIKKDFDENKLVNEYINLYKLSIA